MLENSKEAFILKYIRKENGTIIDSLILGIYTNLNELKNAASGYILKNGEELYITTKKLNEELINRDIDFENEECIKVNENYWNKDKIIE